MLQTNYASYKGFLSSFIFFNVVQKEAAELSLKDPTKKTFKISHINSNLVLIKSVNIN